MYWIVKLKIGDESTSWSFLVGYNKDHPDPDSVYVTLLKSPSFSELFVRVRENVRFGIPHIYRRKFSNGELLTCLDISRFGDVLFYNTNDKKVFSAVTALIRAADWALHFENGMKNKEEWNRWCDNKYYKHLMIN